eukprot:GHVU01170397.1.p1 GENE.GHVU01170397.1~~GHVU01170397.1.p1  ORF type:complete len:135 (+),score=0.88 GHVU01170397.1:27-431(+)
MHGQHSIALQIDLGQPSTGSSEVSRERGGRSWSPAFALNSSNQGCVHTSRRNLKQSGALTNRAPPPKNRNIRSPKRLLSLYINKYREYTTIFNKSFSISAPLLGWSATGKLGLPAKAELHQMQKINRRQLTCGT